MSRINALLFVVIGLVLGACSEPRSEAKIYATDYGLGPDKWATAWLLTKSPAAEGELKVIAPGEVLAGATLFDTVHAEIRRIQSRAAFEVARDALQLTDPTIGRLADIVHQIEINFWTDDGPAEADVVESAYRDLQYASGRDRVSPNCYVAFFERVYRVLKDVEDNGGAFSSDRLAMSCEELIHIAKTQDALVPEVPVADVLSAMAAGERVIFVDVREPDEFAEAHIPGAINLPLRDVNETMPARFAGAAYVVSYCVKDFRGFEMARALADVGVKNSVIMRPFGIKGWVEMGLPITGNRASAATEAQRALDDCLRAGDCLTLQSEGGTT